MYDEGCLFIHIKNHLCVHEDTFSPDILGLYSHNCILEILTLILFLYK